MSRLHAIHEGASALPLSVALSVIPSLPRPLLSRLVDRAIERLDEMDGDTELEPNGDELDGSAAEDDFGGISVQQGLHWCVPIGHCEDDEDDNEDCGHDENEPDFRKRRRPRRTAFGPGCSVADAGEDEHDREEVAF